MDGQCHKALAGEKSSKIYNRNMRKFLITAVFASALGGLVLLAGPSARAASDKGSAETAIINVARDMSEIRPGAGANRYQEQIRQYLHLGRRGDAYALREIGFYYSKGWGVLRDFTKAYMWFTLAGMQGNLDALENRDTIDANVSAEQIARAEDMAKRWLETYEWEIDGL